MCYGAVHWIPRPPSAKTEFPVGNLTTTDSILSVLAPFGAPTVPTWSVATGWVNVYAPANMSSSFECVTIGLGWLHGHKKKADKFSLHHCSPRRWAQKFEHKLVSVRANPTFLRIHHLCACKRKINNTHKKKCSLSQDLNVYFIIARGFRFAQPKTRG